jgi:integrase
VLESHPGVLWTRTGPRPLGRHCHRAPFRRRPAPPAWSSRRRARACRSAPERSTFLSGRQTRGLVGSGDQGQVPVTRTIVGGRGSATRHFPRYGVTLPVYGPTSRQPLFGLQLAAWDYLNQALRHALRRQRIRTNPVQDTLLSETRPLKERRTLTIQQARRILLDAVPEDRNPAMWLTGLMCGLRPGEMAGLRWLYVDIDSDEPAIEVAERAQEVSQKYVGQASPKTKKSRRWIGLHPLLVAALQRHCQGMEMLDLYDPESFVFCTRNGTPFLLRNMRRDFGRLCERAGLGADWTTYKLRHSFVSLVAAACRLASATCASVVANGTRPVEVL